LARQQPQRAARQPLILIDGKPKCRRCNSENLSIQYGKFGYYFKCGSCDGNTPIKISCGHQTQKQRLRKDGAQSYRECIDCKTSTRFFTNPA